MDPYEVLGVSRDADEDTIKKAYRTLVKKYHPDRYVNTPMAEAASEKMKQINEAYDIITNKNTHGNSYGYSTYDGGDYSTISFESARRLISMRRFTEAEAMLNQLPRNAEWYYLMGLVYINRGWYNQGMEYIKTAVRLDPNNGEYASTLASFDSKSKNYREVVFDTNKTLCGICTSLCASWYCLRCACCC